MGKKLKSLKVVRHEINPRQPDWENISGEGRTVSETEYEMKWGKVVRERQFGAEGHLEQETQYTYNQDGFLTGEVLKEGDGMVMEEKSWVPDDKGRISEEYIHYADGSRDTVRYRYDESGNLIRKETVDAEDETEETQLYVYDSEGRLTREASFDGPADLPDLDDAEPVIDKRYVYDQSGRLLETLESDQVNGVARRKVNGYNAAGHQVSMEVFDEDDRLVERVKMETDDSGRPVEIEEESKRKKNRIQMLYDDKGRMVSQEEYDMHGTQLSRVERLYENSGNLAESRVQINMPGMGSSKYYLVKHHYTYFDEHTGE